MTLFNGENPFVYRSMGSEVVNQIVEYKNGPREFFSFFRNGFLILMSALSLVVTSENGLKLYPMERSERRNCGKVEEGQLANIVDGDCIQELAENCLLRHNWPSRFQFTRNDSKFYFVPKNE